MAAVRTHRPSQVICHDFAGSLRFLSPERRIGRRDCSRVSFTLCCLASFEEELSFTLGFGALVRLQFRSVYYSGQLCEHNVVAPRPRTTLQADGTCSSVCFLEHKRDAASSYTPPPPHFIILAADGRRSYISRIVKLRHKGTIFHI